MLPPDEKAACKDGAGNTVQCTDAAAAALAEIAGDAAVTCIKERRLGHGYFLGHCRTADGVDPAEVLLSRGLLQLASDTPLERYAKAAEAAKAAGAGLWGNDPRRGAAPVRIPRPCRASLEWSLPLSSGR